MSKCAENAARKNAGHKIAQQVRVRYSIKIYYIQCSVQFFSKKPVKSSKKANYLVYCHYRII